MRTQPLLAGALAAGLVLAATACTGSEPSTGSLIGPSRPAFAGASGSPSEPMPPLDGDEVTGKTGLTVLVGDTIVDVDSGERRGVTGLAKDSGAVPLAAGSATVIVAYCGHCDHGADLYSLSPGSTAATRIGAGHNVAPAPDGVWVKRYRTEHDCELSKISSRSGATLVPARPIDCAVMPREETQLGLLVNIDGGDASAGDEILAVDDLRPVVPRTPQIHAVIGRQVLSSDGETFTLSGDGPPVSINLPTTIGAPSTGQLSPNGRYVAISFEHPAWPGPRQRLDVWVLDLVTTEWLHLPSMPTAAALKATDEAWAPDGRLVILGQFDGAGQRLVSWRPGESRLSLVPLDRPIDIKSSIVVR